MVLLMCSVCGGAGSLGTVELSSPAWWSQGTQTPGGVGWGGASFPKNQVPQEPGGRPGLLTCSGSHITVV